MSNCPDSRLPVLSAGRQAPDRKNAPLHNGNKKSSLIRVELNNFFKMYCTAVHKSRPVIFYRNRHMETSSLDLTKVYAYNIRKFSNGGALAMKTATVGEIQKNFARVLRDIRAGEEITVTRRGKPVAKISALGPKARLTGRISTMKRSILKGHR